MPRKYTKKSDYWEQIQKSQGADALSSYSNSLANAFDAQPRMVDIDEDVSHASYTRRGGGTNISRRSNASAFGEKYNKYSSIWSLPLPFSTQHNSNSDYICITDILELVYKAYFNIPIFGATINLMSEFSNSEIFLEGGSKRSREFYETWLKTINIFSIKAQYFLEYFRSGNVFIYRIDGNINPSSLKSLMGEGMESPNRNVKIPLRYIFIDPQGLATRVAPAYDQNHYEQILNSSTLSRLKNPSNEEDRLYFESLPKDAQEQIKRGNFGKKGIYVKIEPTRLISSFYKKMDYEPFSVPFGFPVLDDLNAKMELKKIDQEISRTANLGVLLVTMGRKDDDGDYPLKKNIDAVQRLLGVTDIQRTLVADYTTKAEFIIPDITKIIGKEKYAILNEDIKDGLQNIIVGDDRLSNAEVKAKLFLKRLDNARQTFLHEFLMPEMRRLGKIMGFRTIPTALFQKIDLKDEVQWGRMVTRFAELGYFDPETSMNAIKRGEMPSGDDVRDGQEKFVEERKKGYYNPIVGGIPFISGPESESDGEPKRPYITPQIKNPIGVSKAGLDREEEKQRMLEDGRTTLNSLRHIKSVHKNINKLGGKIKECLAAQFDLNANEELSTEQKSFIEECVEKIICGKAMSEWESCVTSLFHNSSWMCLTPLESIQAIQSQYNLEDLYESAIVYHAKELKE